MEGVATVILIIFIFALTATIARFLQNKFDQCPKCKKVGMWRETGNKERDGWLIFSTSKREYRCNKCGYSEWSEDRTGSKGL